jgi:hypothetical protein
LNKLPLACLMVRSCFFLRTSVLTFCLNDKYNFFLGHFWDNEKNREKSMFGNCGINQLVLDLKFCLEALGNFGTEKVCLQ